MSFVCSSTPGHEKMLRCHHGTPSYCTRHQCWMTQEDCKKGSSDGGNCRLEHLDSYQSGRRVTHSSCRPSEIGICGGHETSP